MTCTTSCTLLEELKPDGKAASHLRIWQRKEGLDSYHSVKISVPVPVVDGVPGFLDASKVQGLPVLVLELVLDQLGWQHISTFNVHRCDCLVRHNL